MPAPLVRGDSVVVSAWVGSTNLGDELVFAALRRKLEVLGVGIDVVSVDPCGTAGDHGVVVLGAGDLPGLVRALRTGRGLVLGGGGLLQDETSPLNLPYHLARPALALALRRPVVGVGLGTSHLRLPSSRALVRATLRRALAVSVRDAGSAGVLAALGLPAPVVAADLALSLPLPSVAILDHVAVCLRPWSGRPSALPVAGRPDRLAVPPWFVPTVAAALDAVASATGLGVRFVALQADRDGEVHRRVAAAMRTPSTSSEPGLHGVLDELAGARVVASMRYHGGIGALLGGRPSVLVGYSDKVPALAADVGVGAAPLAFSAEGLAGLPDAVAGVLGRDDDVAAARDRLRTRERRNDEVLARLTLAG